MEVCVKERIKIEKEGGTLFTTPATLKKAHSPL